MRNLTLTLAAFVLTASIGCGPSEGADVVDAAATSDGFDVPDIGASDAFDTRSATDVVTASETGPDVPDGEDAVDAVLVDTGPDTLDAAAAPAARFESLAAGENSTCAIRPDHTAACWGSNAHGALGTGMPSSSLAAASTPRAVAVLTGVQRVAAGGWHACALTEPYGFRCWGANASGQVGDGTTMDAMVPSPVLLDGVVDIALGDAHSCALTSGGTVYCWGSNAHGQLATSSSSDPTRPAAVLAPVGMTGAFTGVVDIGCGANHTCAVLATGAVYCWGANARGQAGQTDPTDWTRPTRVSGIADAVEVAAGSVHTCVRRSTGEVSCWGANSGRLGNGASADSNMPVAVSALTTAVQLGAGTSATCARTDAGSVLCWGALAPVVGTATLVPTLVDAATAAVDLALSIGNHACVRRSDGSTFCWGGNTYGQLGDGTMTDSAMPVPVSM